MCPRCHGSMFPERDRYGAYTACLSCGYINERLNITGVRIDNIDPIGVSAKGQRRREQGADARRWAV